MCSRYQLDIDDDEVARIIQRIEERVKTGDVYPSDLAPVLVGADLTPAAMGWGFPKWAGQKGVVFNARSETVLDKRMFAKSARERRCVIPTTGFYEWATDDDGKKTKYFFRRSAAKASPAATWIAGIWNDFDGEKRFTMLTTEANDDMSPYHNRMPIVIDPHEREGWISGDLMGELLSRSPPGMSATPAS